MLSRRPHVFIFPEENKQFSSADKEKPEIISLFVKRFEEENEAKIFRFHFDRLTRQSYREATKTNKIMESGLEASEKFLF